MAQTNTPVNNTLRSYHLAYQDAHGWQLWVPSCDVEHSYNIGSKLFVKAVHFRNNGNVGLARFRIDLPQDPTNNLTGEVEITLDKDQHTEKAKGKDRKVWDPFRDKWRKYGTITTTPPEALTAKEKILSNINLLRDVSYGSTPPLGHDTPHPRINGEDKEKYNRRDAANGEGHPSAPKQLEELVGRPTEDAVTAYTNRKREWDNNRSK